eukprot:COSAG05_NODE_148_length_16365_cov_76.419218_11_plen_115_part_00
MRGKRLDPDELSYIESRKKAVPIETFSSTVPSNQRSPDIEKLRAELSQARADRQLTASRIEQLDKHRATLVDDLKRHKEHIGNLNKRYLDIAETAREGLKRKKLQQTILWQATS